MHGLIFQRIRQFIENSLGPGGWSDMARSARLPFRVFLATETYPAAEAMALFDALAQRLERTVSDVLEEFGAFTLPALLDTYAHHISPAWRTIDVLEALGHVLDGTSQDSDTATSPSPGFVVSCDRKGPNLLVVELEQPRRWCPFVMGLIRALVAHFDEDLVVNEVSCGRDRDSRCQILIRRAR